MQTAALASGPRRCRPHREATRLGQEAATAGVGDAAETEGNCCGSPSGEGSAAGREGRVGVGTSAGFCDALAREVLPVGDYPFGELLAAEAPGAPASSGLLGMRSRVQWTFVRVREEGWCASGNLLR